MTLILTTAGGNYGAIFTPKIIAKGDIKFVPGKISFDNSYPTGGEAMDLSDHLKSVEGVMFESKAGYVFEYDYTNKKVKVLRHLRTLTVAAHDLAAVTAGTTVDVDITVAGVTTSDRIVGILPPAALEHGIVIQSARVKSANTITIRISNVTAGNIDPAAGDFSFVLEQDVAQEVPNTTDLSALEDVRFLAWGY